LFRISADPACAIGVPFTDTEKKQWNIRVTFLSHVTFMSIDD